MRNKTPELWLVIGPAVLILTVMPWTTEWYRPLYAQYGNPIDLLESPQFTSEETEQAVKDRLEEVRATGEWGLFVNYGYTDVDRDETKRQDGYDSDVHRVTLGADYRRGEVILGGAASYSREDQEGKGSGSDVEFDDYAFVAYGSYDPADSDLFIDGFLNYSYLDYDLAREALRDADDTVYRLRADPDGYRIGAGMNVGHTWRQGPYVLTSIAELEYSYSHVSSYDESGLADLAISFDSRSTDSLTLGGTVIFSRALSTEWAVIVPQLRATYVHEFLADAEDIRGEIQGIEVVARTDNPDRDYFFGAIGVSAITPEGLQFFADYQQRFGHRYLDSYEITLGLRYEF